MANIFEKISSLFGKVPVVETVALQRRDHAGLAVYAVGDVHGCATLYRRLERKIIEDAKRLGLSPCIVLLGDVVDRGAESADMVDHLLAPPPGGVERHCLRGNHEDMMLRFLDKPGGKSSWLDFGGYETLMSYGMRPPGDDGFNLPERQLRLMIETFIPLAHREFLTALPYGFVFGNFALVHAAIDPSASTEMQPKDVLLWGTPQDPQASGLTVVHGHTIVEKVEFTSGRIAVDTGAYVTGQLTSVRLLHDAAPEVIEVSDDE